MKSFAFGRAAWSET